MRNKVDMNNQQVEQPCIIIIQLRFIKSFKWPPSQKKVALDEDGGWKATTCSSHQKQPITRESPPISRKNAEESTEYN